MSCTSRTDRRIAMLAAAVLLGVHTLAVARDTAPATHEPEAAGVSPDDALARLEAGNKAFRLGLVGTNHLTEAWRESLAAGQHPFAMILSCADSRVPPEQVFAQGLGDLFTVRVAGNIAEPATVASLEYAAAHLGSRLLVILGHTQCGAVKAAVAKADDTPAIRELVAAIRPAIDALPRDASLDDAVRANVHHAREQLLAVSTLLSGMVRDQRLKVVEGVYDLGTGEVRMLETH
jgi:carbonic anhydrase